MALATTFADHGDWLVEQQFVLQMGSSYLMAHGLGTPLAKDAATTVEIPEDGEYTLLVRTKNWTKHWSDGPTPGIFQVLVDGNADETVFGTDKVNWYWQKGGKFSLKKGRHTVALHDLAGFLPNILAYPVAGFLCAGAVGPGAHHEYSLRLIGDAEHRVLQFKYIL